MVRHKDSSQLEIGVLSPAQSTGVELLIAAGRAGELAILDTTRECSPGLRALGVREAQLIDLCESLGPRFGVRLDGSSSTRLGVVLANLVLKKVGAPLNFLLIAGACADLRPVLAALRPFAHRIFREVISQAEAEEAVLAGFDGVVVKGNECGGRVGSETTFILLQRLCPRLAIPVWARGGIGPHALAACLVAGARGVILDSQLAMAEESSLPGPLRALVAAMDGSETICLGQTLGCGFRAHRLRGAAAIRELHDLEVAGADPEVFTQRLEQILERPEGEPLFAVGQDAAFARGLAAQHRNVAGILRAYRRQATDNLRVVVRVLPLTENAPLARVHGTRFPIVQGPMTRVSDVGSFAAAVAREGGLPFLALALLREGEAEALLRETAALLGDHPWGVGILGFVPPALRAEQLNAVLKVRPRFALLAGGRPDQARALESKGIATYLHTPSVRLLEMFLKEGTRRFVFEGRECGGHVGPLSSFMLWESQLGVLLDFQRKNSKEELQVLFAGGIHDGLSAAMLSALAAPAVDAGIKVGVLMGTAYLFTHEAVATGAIVPAFQEEALRCEETVLLDMEGGHAIQCAPSAYTGEFLEMKRALLRAGAAPEEARTQLEEVNIGRLRIASKGLGRVATGGDGAGASRLVELSVDRQRREGMYMIGQVAALRRERCSMAELHADVAQGSVERLQQVVPGEAGTRAGDSAPIAIIGMACLFPGASNVLHFWSNILRGHDAIREVTDERWHSALFYDADPQVADRVYSKWGGFLDPVLIDPLMYGIPPTSVWSIEPMQLLMLEVVRRAFADAGYDRRPFPRDRTGVIIGTGGGSSDLGLAYQTRCMVEHYLEEATGLDPAARSQVIAELRRMLPEPTEDSLPGVLPNVAAGRVANRFNLGGPNFTVDAACASSLAALEIAVKELRLGTSDLMVAGAVDVQMSPFIFLMFSKTHALSRSGRCRPFDAAADGIAISEGVAAVLLKRLDDAQHDGDRIYAVLRGIAGASDGRDKSLTAPSVNGQRRALERAYASVDVSPSSVGLVEAHGTGTVVGDRAELETLRVVFETAGASAQNCALGSVKSQIGHSKNAAGLAGLIKTAMALHERVLPPTLVEEPNDAVRDRAIPFYLNTRPRPWLQSDHEPRRAAVSAFGFGGTNFHAVLEECPQHAGALSDRRAELVVFRESSRAALAERLASLAHALASSKDIRLVDLAAALQRRAAEARGACRLAIVATGMDDLRALLTATAQTLRSDAIFSDAGRVAYSESPSSAGAVAFLFPGQGSQYLNMLEDLALHFPLVREVFEQADRVLAGVLPLPLSRVIFPPPAYSPAEEAEQRRALDQTWLAQPALGAADFALSSLFRDVGIAPDMVGGHSYGEYVALCAGGSLTFPELIRISERRGRVIQETQGRDAIGMVAVRANTDTLADVLAGSGVAIAGRNAPLQAIVGGPRAAIEAVLPRLDAAGMPYQVLPMSAGFHIPDARPAADRFAEILGEIRFAAPEIPIYSNSTAGVYPSENAAIGRMLIEHLTQPVRFQDQIEAMYAAGARTFIEVGPGQVLSGLVRQILGERRALVVTANPRGSTSAVEDFLKVVARLFVHGAALRWERLFAGCEIPSVDLEALLQDGEPSSPTAWLVDGARAKPPGNLTRPRGGLPAAPAPQQHAGEAAPPGIPGVSLTHESGGTAADAMAAFQSAMRQFLEYQARAQERRQQLMERFLDTQRAITEGYFSGSVDGDLPSSAQVVLGLEPVAGAVAGALPAPGASEGTPHAPALPSREPEGRGSVEEVLLGLMSERTGYPVEMLGLDHNMEADLGIDSIKRAEIFGALRERMGLTGEVYDQEEYFLAIAKLRTLREVLTWLGEQVPVPLETRLPDPDAAVLSILPEAAATVRRCLVRAVPSTLTEGLREQRAEEIILMTEDASGIASELAAGLRALGHHVALVRHASAPRVTGQGVYEVDLLSRDSLKQLREWIAQRYGKVTALCHLLPLDPGPLPTEAEGFEVKSLFLLASTFGADLREAQGTCIGLTAMGGAFGLQGASTGFRGAQAAIPGFLKSLALEWPEVFVKSIDVDLRESPEYLAPQLIAEVMTQDRIVEVGYTGRGRSVLVAVESALDLSQDPAVRLSPESVMLVTGGGRGITSAICEEMVSRYDTQLILVGRSPLPEAEDEETVGCTAASELKRIIAGRRQRRGELVTPNSVEDEYQALVRARELRVNLQRLSALGARVEYHALDVRDARAFETLIASTYERYGRIDGVIHAAGIIKDGLVLSKSPESFDEVFDTKVTPALTLARVLRPQTLRFLAFFSSVAARTGNPGQADYAGANEVLNKLAWQLDREWPARVVSIGWGPWEERGMAARGGPELRRRQRQAGLAAMSVQEGCERFLQEIAFGRKGEAEVLIFAPHDAEDRQILSVAGVHDVP